MEGLHGAEKNQCYGPFSLCRSRKVYRQDIHPPEADWSAPLFRVNGFFMSPGQCLPGVAKHAEKYMKRNYSLTNLARP